MLSISTSWMGPDVAITDWLRQVKTLGFDAVELSYKVTDEQLQQAEPALKDLGLQVSSIHNFCPTPNDEPSPRHLSNYYRLSSQDEHERRQAVKWTCIAADTARRVGAGVVVIHAGTLDFEDERSPELFRLFVDGKKDTQEFQAECQRVLALRDQKKGPYLDALEKSLHEVMAYAQDNDIRIGLETRYYPIEIPNFDEIGYFLDLFGKQGMGYWHDVGHAEISDRLGITSHRDFLNAYRDQMIGVHIHGMNGRRDHLAPFEGDMNLDELLPYFGPSVMRVVESKPFASFDLMKTAVGRLKI